MVTIRPATPADQEVLARIYLESRLIHFHWADASTFSLDDFARDATGEDVFVACDPKGRITGFITVWVPDSFVHLLFLAPGLERNGIGKRLLEEAALRFGLPLRLKCVAANSYALLFYQSQGWHEVSRGLDHDEPYVDLEKHG